MNQEFFTLHQQDLETLIAKSNCSCHFINPNKTRIILWKETKDDPEIYYLRIGIQKFISYPLKDKNQDIYKPHNLKQITAKISNDMDEKKKLQQEVNILTKEKGADNEEVQQLTKRIEELENSLNKKTLKHTEEKGGEWKEWAKKMDDVAIDLFKQGASEYVEQEMQSDIKNGDCKIM